MTERGDWRPAPEQSVGWMMHFQLIRPRPTLTGGTRTGEWLRTFTIVTTSANELVAIAAAPVVVEREPAAADRKVAAGRRQGARDPRLIRLDREVAP